MKNLRYKIITLALFVYHFGNAQTMESIKEQDTIYLFFDNSDFQKIKAPDSNTLKILEEVKIYEIKFDSVNFINFSDRKYKDFDEYERNGYSGSKCTVDSGVNCTVDSGSK